MNIFTVLAICIVLVTIVITVLILYLMFTIFNINKTLKPINKILSELENQFTPLAKDLGGVTSSINNIVGRIDRIMGLLLNRVDFVAQGAEKASNYLQKFAKNPTIEMKSAFAGIKRGIEVFFKKKPLDGARGKEVNKDGEI